MGFGIGCTSTRTGLRLPWMCASRKWSLGNSSTTRFTLKDGLGCGFLNPIFPWLEGGELEIILFKILFKGCLLGNRINRFYYFQKFKRKLLLKSVFHKMGPRTTLPNIIIAKA